MDVRNFQKEEKVRKAHIAKRMADQRKYLDEQVALKAKAKKAARAADLSWGVEIKKDYDKWQEENLVAEAKNAEVRKQFVSATDKMLNEVCECASVILSSLYLLPTMLHPQSHNIHPSYLYWALLMWQHP